MIKIVLDSSTLFSIDERDIPFFQQFEVYITPANLFEICTHSKSNKINNKDGFVISKCSILKKIYKGILPPREKLLDSEKNFFLKQSTISYNPSIFIDMLNKLANGQIKVSNSKVKKIITNDINNQITGFVKQIEAINDEIKKICIERSMNYNKACGKILQILLKTEWVQEELIKGIFIYYEVSQKEISNLKKSIFLNDLLYFYKKMLNQIIVDKRIAEKSDYFDFDFFMYIISRYYHIDYFITENKRDFQKKLINKLRVYNKILTLKELKLKFPI